MFEKDTLYRNASHYKTVSDVVDFRFDEAVAAVFPDMIHRSIPGYATLLAIMQAIFSAHIKPHALIYDLGCSVGGVTMALAKALPKSTRFIGIDTAQAMLAYYQKAVDASGLGERVKHQQANIAAMQLAPCHGIILNFVLQFLPATQRQPVIDETYRALHAKGLLFVAEKTTTDEDITYWHEQFKRHNGYSHLEIAQKRQALENVMITDAEKTIVKRLQQAGFAEVKPVFQALGFKAWVAEK